MIRDVLIVGGASMGASTAYYLKLIDPSLAVTVFERDPSYQRSSTMLSDGNVRIQFNLEENIRMSLYALEVLAEFSERMAVGDKKPDVAARHQGNLFLTDLANRGAALAGLRIQQALGCDVGWLEPAEVRSRFEPYSGEGYVGGTLGPLDGSVDPDAVLRAYIRKSTSMGAEYLTAEVAALKTDGDRITGLILNDGTHVAAPVVINAAGAWCAALAATVDVQLPVLPVMRSVYVVETAIDNSRLPSVFLPSGLYVLPETAGRFLVGWSQDDDPIGFDFIISRDRFTERVWPELATQLPAFEALHLVGGWAGLYEVNTLDSNAILGEWPSMRGLFLANGFSGHGFQQCHAVGRYLAELITGQLPTLDLSRLGPQRVIDGTPLLEHAGRII